jgi:CRISPR system Cascade subunit CasA
MLNLIEDHWIPVIYEDGAKSVIAPWQMAEEGILRPDWPRPDLNIACYELLIGLLYMADPPHDAEDWDHRYAPDPVRLKKCLAPYAPAFNLIGDGPLFLQDFGKLHNKPNPVDMLFIDSAGNNTVKNNADLMVHRGRYQVLDLSLAAMVLYTFQAFAPAGGAGNRTSMRGGGPLVTLVDPQAGLWPLVWSNTPFGQPASLQDLPWMRPTCISNSGTETFPPDGKVYGVEAFFGMPRRLRLVANEGYVCGVIQQPYGTNYAKWMHPLSPYYRKNVGDEWLPVHPRAGRFGYRNWLGVISGGVSSGTREPALTLRMRGGEGTVIVAGWAMDNMKPRDFIWSVQPFLCLEPEMEYKIECLVRAAEAAGAVLRDSLKPVLAGGSAREAELEAFFVTTENQFNLHMQEILAGVDVGQGWLADLKFQALKQFETHALLNLAQRDMAIINKTVEARKNLALAFQGYGKWGKIIFEELGLEVPIIQKGKAA